MIFFTRLGNDCYDLCGFEQVKLCTPIELYGFLSHVRSLISFVYSPFFEPLFMRDL